MDDQYYVGISKHYKKAHILVSSSIQDNSFQTLCGKQLGENIHMVNPKETGVCDSCQEIDNKRMALMISMVAIKHHMEQNI